MKVSASKPGVQPPKIEKRTGDSIICLIDCSTLVSTDEVVYGIPTFSNTELEISDNRVISDNIIQFRVSGGPTKVPYTDYSIVFTVNTTLRNVITVPVTIRAYSS